VIKPTVEVAIGLIFHQGRILITQRLADAHLPHLWEFPGGKKMSKESFEECLTRELLEELKIQVIIEKKKFLTKHEYPEKIVHLIFFWCRYLNGNVKAVGCQQFKWVYPKELKNYSFPAANQPALEKIFCTYPEV
jgi:mutator protein MutT